MIDSRILIGLISMLITVFTIIYIGIGEPDRQAEFKGAFKGRSIESGAFIFEQNCGPCHGINGQGTPLGPALNTSEFFENRLEELGYLGTMEAYLDLTISGGRPVKSDQIWPRNMPTWSVDYGGPLRNDQIKYVVDFIMNWEEGAVAAGEVEVSAPVGDTPEARGQSLFQGSAGCVACHMVAGTGGQVGPNLTDVYSREGEDYVRESILMPNAVIAEGFQSGIMPAIYGDTLGEQDIEDIIAYLKSASEN
jgi:cbb3-type cytochrome c oxidase subunit III